MIDREHGLPIMRQAAVLNICRSTVYDLPRPVPASDLKLMRRSPLAISWFGAGASTTPGAEIKKARISALAVNYRFRTPV